MVVSPMTRGGCVRGNGVVHWLCCVTTGSPLGPRSSVLPVRLLIRQANMLSASGLISYLSLMKMRAAMIPRVNPTAKYVYLVLSLFIGLSRSSLKPHALYIVE